MVTPFQVPVLTDERIEELLEEEKPVPDDWRARLVPGNLKQGHRRASLDVIGRNGSRFAARIRVSNKYVDNFSAILEYRSLEGFSYRLLRCNGLHPGGHTNHIEGTSFGTSFHVHRATERYQRAGFQIDAYAEQTDGYSSLMQALTYLGQSAAFELESGQQEMSV
jgi:hypothetical protein